MLSKKIKHKNSLLVFLLRIFFGLILFDEKNVILKKKTQRYKVLPHYLDRLIEFLTLYPISLKRFKKIIKKFGYPTSEDYRNNFNRQFVRIDQDNLFSSYRQFDDVYTARLMLTYNRIDFIAPHINFLKKEGVVKVLDYGCGVSDIGILLAKYEMSLSIVDLNTDKLAFTTKRFLSRNLKVKTYPVNNTEKLAKIDEKFDLIIATEIIEHFRKPIQMVNYFYNHLNKGGYLYLSAGKKFNKDSGGDHLPESIHEGKSPKYKNNFEAKFLQVNKSEHLFQKIS